MPARNLQRPSKAALANIPDVAVWAGLRPGRPPCFYQSKDGTGTFGDKKPHIFACIDIVPESANQRERIQLGVCCLPWLERAGAALYSAVTQYTQSLCYFSPVRALQCWVHAQKMFTVGTPPDPQTPHKLPRASDTPDPHFQSSRRPAQFSTSCRAVLRVWAIAF